MKVTISHKGNFKRTNSFLFKTSHKNYRFILEKYGAMGVQALSEATPKATGKTASSWDYNVEVKKGKYTINWTNSNIVNSVPIALIIQYGHATGNGGYVEGIDYINPALKPVFDRLAKEAWKEVTI